MGRSHVLVGAVSWLVFAQPVASRLDHPLSTGELAAGTLICGGAALLPDSDHPNSCIAHALGPVSKSITEAVAAIVRGHRKATHYLAAIPVFVGLAWLLCQWKWGTFLLLALMSSWALRLLSEELDHALLGAGEIAAGLLFAWWATSSLAMGPWLYTAVAAGVLAHDLGDLTTKGPIRFLWPLPWKLSLGVYRTGHWFETAMLSPVLAVAVVALLWFQVGDPIVMQLHEQLAR